MQGNPFRIENGQVKSAKNSILTARGLVWLELGNNQFGYASPSSGDGWALQSPTHQEMLNLLDQMTTPGEFFTAKQ